MKTRVLITLAALFALTNAHAMRWYSPNTGRWFSRDPIGEVIGSVGGQSLDFAFEPSQRNEPYLYVFAANDPINSVDFAGLWRIDRNGNEKASAKPDSGDTVASLAALIGLNTSDYRNWLSLVGPTRMPTTANQPITQCSEFRIPNTVVAYWAGNLGWAGRWWVRWNSSIRYLEDRGFSVTQIHHTGGDDMRLHNDLVAFASSKKLHGLYFWGHGTAPYPSDALASRSDVLLVYNRFSPAYKMALGLVFACDSNNGQSALMSGASGQIWKGFSGTLVPWPFRAYHPDNYLSPGAQATKE